MQIKRRLRSRFSPDSISPYDLLCVSHNGSSPPRFCFTFFFDCVDCLNDPRQTIQVSSRPFDLSNGAREGFPFGSLKAQIKG
jgi:hypothetical protein